MRRRSRWAALCAAVSAALLATMVVAPSAAAAPAPDRVRAATSTYQYYLSLGDSLGFGFSEANFAKFQADSDPTDFAGYTQALASHFAIPAGQTMNMSCPEETTTSMIHGPCPAAGEIEAVTGQPWPYDPQLASATAYLTNHASQRGLITVSIGSNDLLDIMDPTSSSYAPQCETNPTCPQFGAALKTVRINLTTILRALRAAAPRATIVVLAPYNPYGHAVPVSNVAAVALDLTISLTAIFNGARVADAFVPINVKNANDFDCGNLIYYCADQTPSTADGYPSDIHPTSGGYTVIAQAFEKALR